MREILITILLGIIQGLTEFLPVSSSGHLTLVSEIFGIGENNLFTAVALHFGTLLAVVLHYLKDLVALLKPENHKIIGHLILATLPAGFVMLVLNDSVEQLFSSSRFVSFGFLITAIVLLITNVVGKRMRETKPITWKSALIMGTAQACAIFPGISRSGSTISGGIVLASGERNAVADFSFLMSIPIILGSVVFELFSVDFSSINWLATILGVIASFITGYLAIRFMLKIIGKCNFKWFILYLLILFVLTFTNGYIVTLW